VATRPPREAPPRYVVHGRRSGKQRRRWRGGKACVNRRDGWKIPHRRPARPSTWSCLDNFARKIEPGREPFAGRRRL